MYHQLLISLFFFVLSSGEVCLTLDSSSKRSSKFKVEDRNELILGVLDILFNN